MNPSSAGSPSTSVAYNGFSTITPAASIAFVSVTSTTIARSSGEVTTNLMPATKPPGRGIRPLVLAVDFERIGCRDPPWHEAQHQQRRDEEPARVDHECRHRPEQRDQGARRARPHHGRGALHGRLGARGAGDRRAGERREVGRDRGLRGVARGVEQSAEEDQREQRAEGQPDRRVQHAGSPAP